MNKITDFKFLQHKKIGMVSDDGIITIIDDANDRSYDIKFIAVSDGVIYIEILKEIKHERQFNYEDDITFCQHGENPENCDICNE